MKNKLISLVVLTFIIIVIMGGFVLNAQAATDKSWTLKSPNEKIEVTIELSDTGAVTYSTKLDGRDMIRESALGINVTGYENFTTGLTYTSESLVSINETYEMISGKFSEYVDKCQQLTLSFTKNSRVFNIIFRAYDDGMAFRYDIPGTGSYTGGTNSNTGEATTIRLTTGSTVWAMPYNNVYETNYSQYALSGLNNTNLGMPILVRTANNDYMTIGAAEVNSTYAGCLLRGTDTDGNLSVRLCTNQTSNVNIVLPWKSPWRAAVIGSPTVIANSTMFENLAAPNKLEDTDTSWIKPGITAWTWLNGDPCNDGATYMRYVDFAAEMGWDYILMDAGWQPDVDGGSTNYYDWFEPLVAYAKEKGVGLWAWGNRGNLNTEAKCRAVFSDWAAKGIVGVKADYYNNENQSYLTEYDTITKVCAEYHLMVNFHGSNPPSGERRTWPHVIGREGIRGAEQKGNLQAPAQQSTLWPFMRNLVGPMDFTPVLSPSWNSNRQTVVQNVAFAVLIECGINSYADKPDTYRNSPAYDFFLDIPSVWDETRFLDCEPYSYVSVARRTGDNWYVAATCNTAKTLDLPMDFLGDGIYYASIYRDGATINDMLVETVEITKDSVINLPMKATGGAAMKITKSLPVSVLSRRILRAYQTISDNAQLIANYVSIRTASQVLKSEIAIAEAVVLDPVSVANIESARIRINAAIDAFLEVVANRGVVTLKSPWYNKYPVPANVTYNSPTSATILTDNGDLYDLNSSNFDSKYPRNLHLMDIANSSDPIEVTCDVTYSPTANYQTAGIIICVDDYTYASVMRRFHSGATPNQCFMGMRRTGSSASTATENRYGTAASAAKFYLRLVKEGATISAYFREDENAAWTLVQTYTGNTAIDSTSTISVGLYAIRGTTTAAQIPATFENFKINGVVQPFTSNFLTAVPDVNIETPVGVSPALPATVPVLYSDITENLSVVWDPVSPEKYAAPGTFEVEGVIAEVGRYVVARVTVFGSSIEIVPGDYRADAKYIVVAEGGPLNYLTILACYSVDGKLVDMVSKTGSLAVGEFAIEAISMAQSRGQTVKAFLWNADDYVPLLANETLIEPWIVDKSVLLADIASAEAMMSASDFQYYTKLSVDAFSAVLDAVKIISLDDDATRSMVNSAVEYLAAARGELVSRIIKLNDIEGASHYGTSGTYGSNRTYNLIFDGDINTFYDSASDSTSNHAGYDLGAGVSAYLHYVRVYPRSDFSTRINNSTIRGSNTATNGTGSGTTLLATVSVSGAARWYQFDVSSANRSTAYRYFWIQFSSGSWGNASELEFWGLLPGSDLSLLSDRIAYAESLSASDYEAASWASLQSALTAAKAITTSTSQTNVDLAANNLKTSIAQLVLS
ncbi:MAG: glycoside hydrolase family 97 catalytic domain-containing protein [Oscillospiraceae bacterium]|nr:glycoside hydrolase family 97 catalytic domain-containing protein [Oscillospiraceae bacterium]